MRSLVTCARCQARKFEGEVKYDTSLKDYVCRDEAFCKDKQVVHGNKKVR